MLKSQLESILFASTKPVSVKDLQRFFKKSNLKIDKTEISVALGALMLEYNVDHKGVHIINVEDKYQMVTNPSNKDLVEKMIKLDRTGELTQPSLETLTIIAYRGPISKIELEQIRGVNCSLIIRNLMIRGLIDTTINDVNGQEMYNITTEFLQFLGMNTVDELPDYAKLHQIESLDEFLGKGNPAE
ncbi:MAG: SMC-Scp complex subunit ScpB [Patescibacteria group bacterium]